MNIPYASAQVHSSIPSPASAISEIRAAYQKINSLPLKKEKFTYEAQGCVEDGIVTYYLSGKSILKITESGSIGDGSWTNEYYYQSGKVIFCFEAITGGPAIGKVTTTEHRLYIKNDQPIRYMEDQKVIAASSAASELMRNAYKIFGAYLTKDFTSALCN